MNPGPLEGQLVFLTIEPYLQVPVIWFLFKTVSVKEEIPKIDLVNNELIPWINWRVPGNS